MSKKKVMLLTAMVAMLIFSVATSAFAASAYFDYTLGGKDKENYPFDPADPTAPTSYKADLDNYLLGVEIPINQFKVTAEYSKDKAKIDGASLKSNYYLLKGGYRLLQSDVFQLYGDLSYISMKWDTDDNEKYSPIMIGVDGKYSIAGNMFVSGNLDYAVSGKAKADGSPDTDTDYMAAKVKYTYLFTEKFGAAVGYDWSNRKIKATEGDYKYTDTGFTLGVTYNF
ncbi:MAG TPA: hypothetical protein DDW50_17115 [Firmicutes bacterium]|jgi:hypothetical protein|nr:hypothetical protein [Bacillota bacterium]